MSSSSVSPDLKGAVAETMDAGGYTYARLNVGGQDVWAAGPITPLEVGDTVSVSTGMPMPNFTSKTLNRTFEKIYFTEAFVRPGQGGAAAAASVHGNSSGT